MRALVLLTAVCAANALGCVVDDPCPGDACAPAALAVSIVDLRARPSALWQGQTSTLSWTTRGATRCAISPGQPVVPRSGEITVAPGVTTTYTLACEGREGPAVADVTVHVDAPPSDDGGLPDGGFTDAGDVDAGHSDAGHSDAGHGDAGPELPDSGALAEAGVLDGRGPAHRYPFDGVGDALLANDVIGGADGVVRGSASYVAGGLQVETDAYVDLPNGMISSLHAVTIEAWVKWDGNSAGSWQRIFDFGSTSTGEVTDHGGVYTASNSAFVQLSPQTAGGALRLTLYGGTADELAVIEGDAPLPSDSVVHVAFTYDEAAARATLYMDGEPVGFAPWSYALRDIDDVNCWLGRSNYSVDPYFDGVFLELRLYEHALSAEEIEASFAAGPDVLWSEG